MKVDYCLAFVCGNYIYVPPQINNIYSTEITGWDVSFGMPSDVDTVVIQSCLKNRMKLSDVEKDMFKDLGIDTSKVYFTTSIEENYILDWGHKVWQGPLKHVNHGKVWRITEEVSLLLAAGNKKSLQSVSHKLGRKPSAITSRMYLLLTRYRVMPSKYKMMLVYLLIHEEYLYKGQEAFLLSYKRKWSKDTEAAQLEAEKHRSAQNAQKIKGMSFMIQLQEKYIDAASQ